MVMDNFNVSDLAMEVLDKNNLVITVDGSLRDRADTFSRTRYDSTLECDVRRYYDDFVYVIDYDGDIYRRDEIMNTHFEYDDEWYDKNSYGICECCNGVVSKCELHETQDTGEYLCEECATRCHCCEEWFARQDDMTWSEEEDGYVCDHCYNNHYYTCEDCGDVVYEDHINRTGSDRYVCDSCINDHYHYCDRCHEYVHDNDWDYDCDCCNDCRDEGDPNCVDNGFHFINYSDKPAPIFAGDPRAEFGEHGDQMGVGFELEITTIDGSSRVCGPKLVDVVGNRCYYKRDCSCNNGPYRDEIEIIGHPATYDYFMNEFPWDKMCDVAVKNDYVSHDYHPSDSNSCGFHLHFSRAYFGDTQEERERTYAKLLMFFDWCWDDLVKASRRKSGMLRWAEKNISRPSYQSKKDFYHYCKQEGRERHMDHDERYVAVNFTNSATVEIRMCRGSLNPKALRAWADLMFHVIAKCRTTWATELYKDKQFYLEGIRQETRDYLTSKKAFLPENN